MDYQQVQETVEQFLRTEIIADQRSALIPANEDCFESGMLDSMGLFRLLTFISDHFHIRFDNDALVPENFASLEVISQAILKQHASDQRS